MVQGQVEQHGHREEAAQQRAGPQPLQEPHGHCVPLVSALELETKVREDSTITEKTPTKAVSWLKAPTIKDTI